MTTYKKLRVCHKDILRRLLGVPRWASASSTFVQAGLDNVDVILGKDSCSLRTGILQSQNEILKTI